MLSAQRMFILGFSYTMGHWIARKITNTIDNAVRRHQHY